MREDKKMISEQDLFNYVFFPESISEDKKVMISEDKSLHETIEFYRMLKENNGNSSDRSLREQIARKIPAYSLPKVIMLHRMKEPVRSKPNGNRLAAGSKELKAKMTTRTFVDNDQEYLIKVLNYGNMTKVFVFSTKDEVVKNFDLIIEPHNLHYHFEDNTEPLKIAQAIEAESIILEII